MHFSFENRTRIHFGEGQIEKLQHEIPEGKKVLLVYGGGSIKKTGVYDQVSKALSNHKWQEFSGIPANPEYNHLMQGVEKVKAEGIDYILAVGGGSVIDGAKFIAAAALYEGADPWDMVVDQEKVEDALPLGCVLTLPATGSESNTGSVVTRDTTKLAFLSPCMRPRFAILDPKVTLTLPKRQIGNGVVDAYVHVMEQYLTYPTAAKVQDRYAEGLLQTLLEEGPVAMENPNNLAARGNIMWAANQALNNLIGAGVPQDWTTHLIGHELTGLYGIDHARTLSIVLPAVMKARREQKKDKLLQYGKRVFGLTEGDATTRIDKAIELTINFFQQMELPTSLKQVDLGEEAIEPVIEALAQHCPFKLGENADIELDDVREILKLAAA